MNCTMHAMLTGAEALATHSTVARTAAATAAHSAAEPTAATTRCCTQLPLQAIEDDAGRTKRHKLSKEVVRTMLGHFDDLKQQQQQQQQQQQHGTTADAVAGGAPAQIAGGAGQPHNPRRTVQWDMLPKMKFLEGLLQECDQLEEKLVCVAVCVCVCLCCVHVFCMCELCAHMLYVHVCYMGTLMCAPVCLCACVCMP